MWYSWTTLLWTTLITGYWAAQPTWPSPIDELEDVMFLGSGHKSRGLSAFVTPCSYSQHGPGRQTAAEWVQTAFHDMATTDVYYASKGSVHGGIDASLAFELNSGENIGTALYTSLRSHGRYFNSRLSMSDLIALGVYAGVRACGGPLIPMRGGRIDATSAGPLGVPQPENGIGQFTNQFARMGFTQTEMIAMTACGHTLGGVHTDSFVDIVAPGSTPNDFQLFDGTEAFDNVIATRYIYGPDINPLSVGISTKNRKNSDFHVFNADKNVTLMAMTNPKTFDSMCVSILQRMIETVPPSVTLSDVIEPYEVKPSGLQLTLLSEGAKLTFSGDIRVRTTVNSASQILSVRLSYRDRDGIIVKSPIEAKLAGSSYGFDDTFSYYSFSRDIPVSTSISSFTVLITKSSGEAQLYDNNSKGFPMSDGVIVQTPQSCLKYGKLNVLAAVRGTITTPVEMTVTQKVPRNEGSPTPSPVPSLVSATMAMLPGATMGPYTLYSGSSKIASSFGVKYGVINGQYSDTFKDADDLGDICKIIDTTPVSSSSYISDTTASEPGSSSPNTILVTTHQPKLGQQKSQNLKLKKLSKPTVTMKSRHVESKKLSKPTKSTKSTRVKTKRPASTTKGF